MVENSRDMGAVLLKGLKELQSKHSFIETVRGKGKRSLHILFSFVVLMQKFRFSRLFLAIIKMFLSV